MTSTSEYPSALPPSADNESSNSDPSSVSEEDGKTSKAGGKLADALRRAVNVRRFIHERRENQEHAETQGDEAGPTRADLMARLDLAESIIASQEEEIRCFPNIPSLLVEPTVTRAVCRQQYLEIDSLVKSCTDSARKFVMHREKTEKEAKSLQEQATKYQIAAEQSGVMLRQSRSSTEQIARSLLSMILDFQLELKSLAESFRADQELHEGKAPQPTEVASLVEDTEEQVRSLELELVILSEESLTFQQKAEQMLATLTVEKGICESALSHARGQNVQLMEELQHYKSAQTSINSKLEARNQDFIPANISAAERSGDSSAFSNGHAQRTTSPGGHAMNPATPPVDAEKSTRELYVKLTAANEEIAALQSSLAQQEREGARAASNAELLRSELARKEEQLRDATEQVVSLRLEQARNRDTPAHAPAANTPTPHMPDPSTVSQIQESLAQLEEEFRSVQHFFALDHNPPLALGKAGSLGSQPSLSSLRHPTSQSLRSSTASLMQSTSSR